MTDDKTDGLLRILIKQNNTIMRQNNRIAGYLETIMSATLATLNEDQLKIADAFVDGMHKEAQR